MLHGLSRRLGGHSSLGTVQLKAWVVSRLLYTRMRVDSGYMYMYVHASYLGKLRSFNQMVGRH